MASLYGLKTRGILPIRFERNDNIIYMEMKQDHPQFIPFQGDIQKLSHANTDVDMLKVIKMLLVHDLVEIDAGDTFAYDTVGNTDKYDRELKAAHRLFEFEAKQTSEAQFASSLDRLQPIIHNHQNEGDTWQKYNITSEQVLNRNREIANGSETLWEYAQQLIQKSVDQGILTKS
ncbi:hypothetical protein HK101_000070 [Irineochytrium annulatum]|nr:hypothetical protein HK101_000070 [Irineochytrium annulatum]